MRTGLDRGHFEEVHLFHTQQPMERDPNLVRLGEQMNSRDDTVSRRHSATSSDIRYPRSSVICFSKPMRSVLIKVGYPTPFEWHDKQSQL